MLKVETEIVEQHIAEPAAEHDAERRPDQEIVDARRVARRASAPGVAPPQARIAPAEEQAAI